MSTILRLALIASLTACGQPSPKQPATPAGSGRAAAPSYDSWSFAPPSTALGVVVSGEVLSDAEGILRAYLDAAAGDNDARDALQTWLGLASNLLTLPPELFVDPIRAGLAPEQGAAVFLSRDGAPLLLLLPVDDRARFVQVAKATREQSGDRQIDRIGPLTCAPDHERYVCIAAGVSYDLAVDAPLAVVARKRGVATRPLSAAVEPQLLGYLGHLLEHPVTIDGTIDGASVRLHAFSPGIPRALENAKPIPHDVGEALIRAHPSGFGYFRVPRPLIGMDKLHGHVGGGVDAGELVHSLSGELAIYTRAQTDPAGGFLLGIKDQSLWQRVFPFLCRSLDGSIAGGEQPAPCVGPSTTAFGAFIPGMAGVALPWSAHLSGPVVAIEAGAEASASSPPVTAAARELVDGDWLIAVDARAFAPGWRPAHFSAIGGPERAVDWFLAMTYELGFGIGARGDGLHAVLHVDTYAGERDARELARRWMHTLFANDPAAWSALREFRHAHSGSRIGEPEVVGPYGLITASTTFGFVTAIAAASL